jgi:hypothetical protein
MRSHLRSLSATLVVAAVGVAPALVAPAAHGLPVFTVAQIVVGGSVFDDSTACTAIPGSSDPAPSVAVAENGPPATASGGNTGTVTRDSDTTDVVTAVTSIDGSGSVTSVGGNPRTLDLTASGSVEASTTKPTSTCTAFGHSVLALFFDFTVSQGGFFTMTTATTRHTVVDAYVAHAGSPDRYVQLTAEDEKTDGTARVFLPPGRYSGNLTVQAYVRTSLPVPRSPVRVSVHAGFVVAGSQSAAVSGKGRKYVTYPSARSCDRHVLTTSITGRKKRAHQVKQVSFFVNDVLVTKVRSPRRGRQVTLPVADEAQADVRSEVRLFPTRQGRPGRVLETTAAYEACS